MAKIAFLGTGIMGVEMAHKLIDAGHDLTVYNRTGAKTQTLAAAGASILESPAAAASSAEFIFAMVADDAASRAIWLGPAGAAQADLRPGAIAVECSTLSHDWVMELQRTLDAAGARFADCPVTGGPDGARAGTLRVLAGAEPDALADLRPILLAFAREIIHFGPVGSGTCYKLIVNLIGTVQATALAEGLVLAERTGLDPATVGHALGQSTVASPHVLYLLQRMLANDHEHVYFSAALRYKDAAYALQLADGHDLQLPTAAAATELFRLALDQGLGQKNSSIIQQVLRDLQTGQHHAKKS